MGKKNRFLPMCLLLGAAACATYSPPTSYYSHYYPEEDRCWIRNRGEMIHEVAVEEGCARQKAYYQEQQKKQQETMVAILKAHGGNPNLAAPVSYSREVAENLGHGMYLVNKRNPFLLIGVPKDDFVDGEEVVINYEVRHWHTYMQRDGIYRYTTGGHNRTVPKYRFIAVVRIPLQGDDSSCCRYTLHGDADAVVRVRITLQGDDILPEENVDVEDVTEAYFGGGRAP